MANINRSMSVYMQNAALSAFELHLQPEPFILLHFGLHCKLRYVVLQSVLLCYMIRQYRLLGDRG